MNEQLIAAEAATEAARAALAEAIAEAERIAERLTAGDETVTVTEAMEAPAAVKVAEAKLTAATRKLRQAEDGQPLPAAPALRVSAGVTEAGQVLAGAEKAAQTARAGLLKAEHNLLTAQGKLEAAEGRLAEAVAGDPAPAVHLAKVLSEAGILRSHVEVAARGDELPKRGTLPLLRVSPGGGRRVLLTHYGRFEDDGVPDGREIARVLSLDGWRNVPWNFDVAENEDGSILASTSIVDMEPRAVAAWAEAVDINGEDGHDMLDGMDEILSEARHALRGGHRDMKVYSRTNRAPLALSVAEDGLHTVTVGLAVSHYTNGSTPLSRGADGEAMAKLWRALVGATDWMLGVVVKVEPVKGVPSWAAEVPVRVESARDTVVHYAKVTAVFRVAEGRTVNLRMLGLANAA